MAKKEKLKVDTYSVVARAVEEGISSGMYRAYKHSDTPLREHVEQCVRDAIMSALCEVILWPDP